MALARHMHVASRPFASQLVMSQLRGNEARKRKHRPSSDGPFHLRPPQEPSSAQSLVQANPIMIAMATTLEVKAATAEKPLRRA